ncbi:MAG TPA: phytoene/squalene synthase family protein [Bacteroidia bacterium]|jgi:phytoene/squalene synthetase|nr:phytoene/squalene synthase family protein [Bacteroidia bacterium]
MKQKFDKLSYEISKKTTLAYSTSFSLGIQFLNREFHSPIYAVYGFVRFADEIVDSFHGYDKKSLLAKFKSDTYEALDQKISLNPVLNSFQETVHRYHIQRELIDTFLHSMEMDLQKTEHTADSYEEYILGSAEVVGLMCLQIFTKGNMDQYEKLKPAAMKLGSAFQKVNFLRDANEDFHTLGRNYFPDVNLQKFTSCEKERIEADIERDFNEALIGIRQLPSEARRGVYLAYYYYRKLFEKICRADVKQVMAKRIRIPNLEKFVCMFKSYFRHQFNLL